MTGNHSEQLFQCGIWCTDQPADMHPGEAPIRGAEMWAKAGSPRRSTPGEGTPQRRGVARLHTPRS